MAEADQRKLPPTPLTEKDESRLLGPLPPALYQEDETTSISKLRITRDEFLSDARWVCVNDNIDHLIQAGLARQLEMPSREAYCETAVEESFVRGTNDDLYTRFDASAPAQDTWQRILRSALKNQLGFNTADGERHALTCPLAFEAGYRYGIENPTAEIAPEQTDQAIEEAMVKCFEPKSTISRSGGVVIGTRRAQQRVREVADASTVTPNVPLKRATQIAER